MALIRIPTIISTSHRWPAALLSFLFVATVYAWTNRFALPSAPLSTLIGLDTWIPFWPETIWIYFSLFLLLPYAVAQCRTPQTLQRAVLSFVSLAVVSSSIFALVPTIIPRDPYPLPSDLAPLTRSLWALLRATDQPQNCLPSLHAAVATLIVFNDHAESQRLRPGLLLWAIVLILSTLTTKQHSILDVSAGIGLGLGVGIIYLKLIRFDAPAAKPKKASSPERR